MSGGARPGTAGTTGAAGSGVPVNLIKNGDFSLGKEYWDLTYQAGEVAADNQGSGGQYCIMNASSSFYLSFSLGYPPTPSDAFTIAAGSTYTLTYHAAVDQPASVMVKIGAGRNAVHRARFIYRFSLEQQLHDVQSPGHLTVHLPARRPRLQRHALLQRLDLLRQRQAREELIGRLPGVT